MKSSKRKLIRNANQSSPTSKNERALEDYKKFSLPRWKSHFRELKLYSAGDSAIFVRARNKSAGNG